MLQKQITEGQELNEDEISCLKGIAEGSGKFQRTNKK